MFFASEKVYVSSGAVPSAVGTGATPQSTASPYTAIAHGPTIAIAALPSAKESPLYVSFGDRPSEYIVAQKSATALPASLSNVAAPSSTSCEPPVSAAYSG